MNKLHWCKKQAKGIRIGQPNPTLCKAYLTSSDEDLTAMTMHTGKWKTIAAYYACYESVYALLQKIGITCEIHDCSIELLRAIPGYTLQDYTFITTLKKERLDTQYYLKTPLPINEQKVKTFILTTKHIIATLHEDARQNILRQLT